MRWLPANIQQRLKRPETPGVRSFAILNGIEAIVRGVALAVYPLLMYRAWGDAAVVAEIYFAVGIVSLLTGLAVPFITRHVPRRFVYSAGTVLFMVAAVLGIVGGKVTALALLCNVLGTALVFTCFNAYVLDNIPVEKLGRLESLRLLFAGTGWTLGPFLGVWLAGLWHGAPFVIVGLGACLQLAAFWYLRIFQGRATQVPPHAARVASTIPSCSCNASCASPGSWRAGCSRCCARAAGGSSTCMSASLRSRKAWATRSADWPVRWPTSGSSSRRSCCAGCATGRCARRCARVSW